MQILFGQTEKEIKSKLRELDYYKEQEKARDEKSEVARLKRRIDELREEHSENLSELRDDQRDEIRSLNKEHISEIEELNDQIDELTRQATKDRKTITRLEEEVKGVAKREATVKQVESDLEVRAAVLDQRESLLEVREKTVNDATTQNDSSSKANQARVEAVREEGYKSGYADGVGDGVRAGRDIGDQDRELTQKVVMVALARDNKDFATELGEIAKENLKNVLTAKPAQNNTSKKS